MDLDSCIEKRHSVRSFKSIRKPSWKKIIAAIDAGVKIPYAGNIPTLKFIIVSDQEKIAKIAEACVQDFVATVDYVVVVCSNPVRCIRAYGERGEVYFRQQAGAAIENFLLKLTDLGIGSCWVGAFSEDMIKRALQIPDNVFVEGVFPIGYEKGSSARRKKPDLDSSIYFNKWNNKLMSGMPQVEV